MSNFKEVVKESIEKGIILDSCGEVERFYDYGRYIDLCGLDPKDIVENMQNDGTGGGGSSKTNVVINGVVTEENGEYYVVFNATSVVLDMITISMIIDGKTQTVTMQPGSTEAKFGPVEKYCEIENITVTPQSTSVAKYSTNVVNPNGKGLFNVSVIKVINNEETLMSTNEYKYKDIVNITATDIEGYDFINWDNGIENGDTINIEFEMPEHDVEVRCYYNIKTFTITWLDDDDTKLASTTVNYGDTPVYPNDEPSKVSTQQYDYTFTGWKPTVTAATDNTTYIAEYSSKIRQYTVTWKNYDGEKLTSTTVNYGETPVYPEDGPKIEKPQDDEYTYTFSGWDPIITEVTKDAEYTAQYTSQIRQYNITFIVGDDKVTIPVNYGETPVYPNGTPTKESTEKYDYTFTGWDKELSPVTGEETYTAQFTNTIRKYSLNVEVINGTYTIEEPTPDMYYEYDQNVTIKATSTNEHYTVDGKEGSGTFIEKTITITGVTYITCEFIPNKYDITFNYKNENGEDATSTLTLEYKTNLKEASDKILTPNYVTPDSVYTFSGWTPEITDETKVEGTKTYTAQYDSQTRQYEILFVNEDGTVLQSSEIEYGATPVYTGETPTKAATAQYTYTFDGWTPTVVSVTGNTTYTATFSWTVNEYTITFVNEDGTELQKTDVEYGKTPTYTGETPTKAATAQYTYTFDGWTPSIAEVIGDATYTATFSGTVNEYTITWKNGDEVLKTEQLEYGTTPSYNGTTPSKEATEQYTYTFSGWDPEITNETTVTGDITYTATFVETERVYTLTLKDENDVILTGQTIPCGEDISSVLEANNGIIPEGYSVEWINIVNGEKFTSTIMPTNDLTLKRNYIEKSLNSSVYYSMPFVNELENLDENKILEKFSSFEYNDSTLEYDVRPTIPFLDNDDVWTEFYDNGNDASIWKEHGYVFCIAIPSSVLDTHEFVYTEDGQHPVTLSFNKEVTINNTNYDVYVSSAGEPGDPYYGTDNPIVLNDAKIIFSKKQ